MTDVRHGLAQVLDSAPAVLETVVIAGVEHYFQAGTNDVAAASSAASGVTGRDGGPAGAGPRIDLIQCYDEYVMGYSATRHYFGGGAPAFPLGGAPMHVVLLDGRMAGSWRHTLFPGRCELDIRLVGSSDAGALRGKAVEGAVQSAVERYGAFLGIPAVRVGSRT
jgi:hypothetical protein